MGEGEGSQMFQGKLSWYCYVILQKVWKVEGKLMISVVLWCGFFLMLE